MPLQEQRPESEQIAFKTQHCSSRLRNGRFHCIKSHLQTSWQLSHCHHRRTERPARLCSSISVVSIWLAPTGENTTRPQESLQKKERPHGQRQSREDRCQRTNHQNRICDDKI